MTLTRKELRCGSNGKGGIGQVYLSATPCYNFSDARSESLAERAEMYSDSSRKRRPEDREISDH